MPWEDKKQHFFEKKRKILGGSVDKLGAGV
jgi:hypothetical protein